MGDAFRSVSLSLRWHELCGILFAVDAMMETLGVQIGWCAGRCLKLNIGDTDAVRMCLFFPCSGGWPRFSSECAVVNVPPGSTHVCQIGVWVRGKNDD